MPFPVSNGLSPNFSFIPKPEKDLIAVGETHQFLSKILQKIQLCEKYGTMYLCWGQQTTSSDQEETYPGAYYLEKWSAITSVTKF
jgi:hypothetical protein